MNTTNSPRFIFTLIVSWLLAATGPASAQYSGGLGTTWNNPISASASSILASRMGSRSASGASTGSSKSAPAVAASSAAAAAPAAEQLNKAVRFQSTGTRLMLSRVVDSMNLPPEQKPQTERALRQILDDYDATMRRNSFPNDLALALSTFLGMSSAVYHEHQMPSDERLIELRNIIAESAFQDRIFQNADDRKKQELYETVIMYGTLAYAGYENAKQKGSREEMDKYRQFAGENIKSVFRLSPDQLIFTQSGLKFLTPLK